MTKHLTTGLQSCLLILVLSMTLALRADSIAPSGRMDPVGTPALVPWPTSFKSFGGSLTLSTASRIAVTDDSLLPLAKILADEMFLATGLRPEAVSGKGKGGDIELSIDKTKKNEAYVLKTNEMVSIAGTDYNAVAMGTVTLLQSLKSEAGKVTAAKMLVDDEPKLKYRAAMLDIVRKPHSIDTLKACVEVARFYKIRYFQLHMSDENAWTFPSTAYPQLGNGNFAWAGGEKPEVYKLDELKALVAFADARGVTIVPELEAAGHSGQMRASLPDIFQFKDADGKLAGGGVINICSPKAYEALDTLAGEMAEVFKSSPYIHCGCDEASFGGTEVYPDVKAFMEKNHLADTGALFNFHIARMDEIVKKHGKQMIVWEGAPIDPVLPPKDIIFMPWVGGSGFAATLVADGYDVINAPWGVKKAYMDPYEVNGAQLNHGEPKLIGATAISWQAVQETAVPFMRYNASLRNEPTHNVDSNRTIEDFILREAITDVLLDRILHGFTFKAEGILNPLTMGRLDPMFTAKGTLTLETNLKSGALHYTLDGSEPTGKSAVYSKPIVLKNSTTVRAVWIGETTAEFLYPYTRDFRKVTQVAHDAVGAKVTFTPELPGYPGPGPKGLTDGILAPGDNYLDPGFVGWTGAPVQITLDLGTAKSIHMIAPRSVRSDGGLDLPGQVEFQLSNDGKEFHTVGTVLKADAIKEHGWFVANLRSAETARFVRLNTPPGTEWIFIDEIVVNGKLPGPNLPSESVGKTITFTTPPSDSYNKGGPQAATDGYVTPTASFAQLEWLGWENVNIEAVIDMGKPTVIHEAGGRFLQHVWSGVFPPTLLTILVSDDGKNFKEVGKVETVRDQSAAKIYTIAAKLNDVKARYVKITANTNGSWLFTDELFVNPQ